MTLFARAAPLALIAAGVLACSQNMPSNSSTETPGSRRPDPIITGCGTGPKDTMKDEAITIREGTQPTLSGKLVGVADIWERELPQVGSRMAAKVVITTPGERQGIQHFAYEGLELVIGSDRYCITKVAEYEMVGGSKGPGSIALRKLP